MQSKISLPERILMLMLAIMADSIDGLAALGIGLPFIGAALPFISWPIGFTISAILLFWVFMKGAPMRWMLGGSGLELIPIVNALPGRTAGVLMTIAMDLLPPEAKAVASVATGKKSVGKGAEVRGRSRTPEEQEKRNQRAAELRAKRAAEQEAAA